MMDMEYNFKARCQEVIDIIERKEKVLINEIATCNKLTESYKKQLPIAKQRLKAAIEKLPRLRRSIETLEKKIERVEDKYEQTKVQILIVERVRENDILAMRKGNIHAKKITNLIEEIQTAKDKFNNTYQCIMTKRRGICKMEGKLEDIERKIDVTTKKNKDKKERIENMKNRSNEITSHGDEDQIVLQDKLKKKENDVENETMKLIKLKATVQDLEKELLEVEKELNEISQKNAQALKKVENAKVAKMCKVSKTSYSPK